MVFGVLASLVGLLVDERMARDDLPALPAVVLGCVVVAAVLTFLLAGFAQVHEEIKRLRQEREDFRRDLRAAHRP